MLQIRNNCGNSGGDNSYGNTNLWHKGCCHNDKAFSENYFSPMMNSIHESFKSKKKAKSHLSKKDIVSQCKRAWKEEKQYGE